MASGIFYPVVGADDGFIGSAGGFYYTWTRFWMGDGGEDNESWIRFPNINIPQGATITEAYVKFTAYSSMSTTTVNLNCHFENSDDAVAPVDNAAFYALSLTGAVAWNDLPAWVNGTQYDTPNLVSILQNVVDRGGWSSGNAVQVVIKNNGSTTSMRREASSIELTSGAEKAELHVTWASDTEITLPNPFSSETSLQSNIQVELVPGILSAEASMSIGELFYGIFVECPSPFTAEGLLQANTEIDITATSFIAQTNLQSNIQVELIPNVLSAETSISIGELFCGVMLECPSPFTAVGSLQANIGHSITIVPFIAQTNLQSNIQVEIVPPSFVATSSLDSIVTLLHRSSLSLINGIRFGSDLSLINSLNLDINSQLALVNDILTGLTGDLILKMDINELAKLNDALTLINNINDENSGVSQGPFYFLKSHGL